MKRSVAGLAFFLPFARVAAEGLAESLDSDGAVVSRAGPGAAAAAATATAADPLGLAREGLQAVHVRLAAVGEAVAVGVREVRARAEPAGVGEVVDAVAVGVVARGLGEQRGVGLLVREAASPAYSGSSDAPSWSRNE